MSAVKNVILVTADSFRYDTIDQTVDDEAFCPFLQELAAQGVSFESAYSTGNGTSTAFPGVLAGSLPLDHGYRGLADGHVSIAEHLQEKGIRTVGVTASSHACSLFNYNRGFDRFYENPKYRPEAENRNSLSLFDRLKQSAFDTAREMPVAKQVGERVLNRVRNLQEDGRPTCPFERAETITNETISLLRDEQETYPDRSRFTWIHYMEPHGPYLPPESVLETADTFDYELRDIDSLWDQWFENRGDLGVDSTAFFSYKEREALRRFYLLQAQYLDKHLRRLYDFVEAELGWDETLLLFTTDHGEEFFEHGDLGHRPKLIDELLHVPFLTYSENSGAETRSELVSHVDIASTVSEVLDVDSHDEWQGQVISPILHSDADWDGNEYVFAELCHTEGYGGEVELDQAVHAVYTEEWKYVQNYRTGEERLYSRGANEIEENDVSESEPEIEQLRRLVQGRRNTLSDKSVTHNDLSEDVRDRLHRLGYVGE